MKHGRKHSNEVDGRELVDSTPFEPTVSRPPPSLSEQVRQMVRSEQLSILAEQEGFESFDEADDFDVDGFEEPLSRYEEREFEGEERPDYSEAEQSLAISIARALKSVAKESPATGEDAEVSGEADNPAAPEPQA
jgi:hypothetical protein